MNTTLIEIIKDKPHLEAPLRLYEKVLTFEEKMKILTEGRINAKDNSYPQDLLDTVIEEFSRSFDISEEYYCPLRMLSNSSRLIF